MVHILHIYDIFFDGSFTVFETSCVQEFSKRKQVSSIVTKCNIFFDYRFRNLQNDLNWILGCDKTKCCYISDANYLIVKNSFSLLFEVLSNKDDNFFQKNTLLFFTSNLCGPTTIVDPFLIFVVS